MVCLNLLPMASTLDTTVMLASLVKVGLAALVQHLLACHKLPLVLAH